MIVLVNNPKRSIRESTSPNKFMNFLKKHLINLEVASRKLIELNLIKPKAKIGLNSFLNLMQKWRNDFKNKKNEPC